MKINVKINLIVFLNLTMIYLLFNSAAIAGISSRSTLIPIEVNHKVGYMNKYGEMIIPPHFDNGKYFNDSGLAVVRIGEKWGYIDKRGKTIIPFKYDSAEYFRYDGGLTPVRINQKWGYIDSSDRMIIKPIFDYATHFYFGIAEVRLNDKWGYINQSGKFVIVPKGAIFSLCKVYVLQQQTIYG